MWLWSVNRNHDMGMRNYYWVPTRSQQASCLSKAGGGRDGRFTGQPTSMTMAAPCPSHEEGPVFSKGQAGAIEVEVGAGTGLKLGMRLWLEFVLGLDLGWGRGWGWC